MDDISTRVRSIAADVFEVEPSTVSDASTPDDIETWDSLALLNLMVALEDEFSITLPPDDVAEAPTLGHIVALVAARVAG